MKWHILGVGAIGGLWATRLALAGYPVELMLKNRDALRAFEDSPLQLETQTRRIKPEVEALALPELDTAIDWLLVTTKSFATLDALAAAERHFAPRCHILLLQNGLGMHQRVVERYPQASIIAGVTTDGARRRGRFHVVEAGRGRTHFGPLSPVPRRSLERLQACFARIDIDIEWVADIQPWLWRKLAINCCINALSARRQCRNGELLEHEFCRRQMRGLAAEVRQVLRASGLGFSLPNLYPEVCAVLQATADNYSSMCLDVKHGRRTEVEQINGFICAEGERLGVPTPLNRAQLEAILALARILPAGPDR